MKRQTWLGVAMLTAAAAIGGMLVLGKDPFARGHVKKDYEMDGLQPGETLPADLMVTRIDGSTCSLRSLCDDGPILIVTGSLTCHVSSDACRGDLAAMAEAIAPDVRTILLYTIDAHPIVDPSPYSKVEWVTAQNRKAGILRRQPTTPAERQTLATEFIQRTGWQHDLVMDTLDNAGWQVFGSGPNVALLVDGDGVVMGRNGWFDAADMKALIDQFRRREAAREAAGSLLQPPANQPL